MVAVTRRSHSERGDPPGVCVALVDFDEYLRQHLALMAENLTASMTCQDAYGEKAKG